MAVRRTLLLSLYLGGLCLGMVPIAAGQAVSQQDTETPVQKAARLDREVAELNDVIEMLMENLANCAEENESLAAEAGARRQDGAITGKKAALLDKIRIVLDTEENLAFLALLNERELNNLLGLIEERVKRSKQQ